NSNLTSVTSQEENTYIQHRHGGDTGWIGLQDIDSEGNFTWIDGTNVNFTYWAKNQPNGYPGDQDCVHTLGLRHDYHWNDVTCGSCHSYTCKRDINECSVVDSCHPDAFCTNTIGSYICQCNPGYNGDGKSCSDVDECSSAVHTCDGNAQCINTKGSYTCNCHVGFSGDGRNCSASDIRLVGSSNRYEGRLEVYHNGQWGTVCDDVWDQNSNGGTVACRQLGFSGVQSYDTDIFGQGTGIIWLDDVTCTGTEQRIQDCPHLIIPNGVLYCSHSEDVGIICIP
ncbi:neurotrypsin, partial [Exaiptasia diaphana]|uniref:Uncharacterized protein n=1 Tax=Exaiptasia diaphana TaxID=2652724 RepID=A0A913YWK3_EXADI